MEIKEIVSQALVDSIKECFLGVLNLSLTETQAPDKDESAMVSAIGFAGQLEGSLSIILSSKAACSIVGKMLYMDFAELSADVFDGIGEVVNMTMGGMKNRLTGQFPFEISIPTTVKGKHIDVFSQKGLTSIAKSFCAEDFQLDVILYFKLHSEKPSDPLSHVKISAAEKLAAFVDKNK